MPRRCHVHKRPIDFDRIKRKARLQSDRLLAELLPGGVVRGDEYVVLNPRGADSRLGSFSIHRFTGQWADFAIGVSGNNFVSLAAYVLDLRPRDAAERVAEMLSVGPSWFIR
jgi:hypothetical protein